MHCFLTVLALICLYGGHCFSVWLPVKDEVWWDFSLANLVNQGNSPSFNSPISYFHIVHYWLYSKFANFSSTNLLQKAIRQAKVLPNCRLLR